MLGSLAGFTVGVTGDRRWEEQAELLARRGAQILHGPVMRTRLLHDADATLAATEEALRAPVDLLVLTTGIGTRSWFGVAETAGLDDRLRAAGHLATVLARGPKARGAAEANGLQVHWEAAGETGAEVLAHLRTIGVADRRVVVQRDGGDPVLADAVRALGAHVVDIPVYRWTPPDDAAPAVRLLDAAIAGRVHALTFTCAYAVGSAFELASDAAALADALRGPVLAVSVGPVTSAALRARGIDRIAEPERRRLGAMVQSLVGALEGERRSLRWEGHEVRWCGDLIVQPDETSASLTAGESRVLRELLERAPAVVTKRTLAEPGADDHAAEVVVARLRAKLGIIAGGIGTVPRRGYACSIEVGPGS